MEISAGFLINLRLCLSVREGPLREGFFDRLGRVHPPMDDRAELP